MTRPTLPVALFVFGISVVAACGYTAPAVPPPTSEPPCQGPGCEVRPRDPSSLTELPGYAALKLGGATSTFAVSPDSRKLALLNWQRSWLGTGTLHMVDIRSWTELPMNVSVEGYVPQILFGSDAKALFWTRATRVIGIRNGPSNFVLYRYDLERRALEVVATFPAAFNPREMRLLRSGDRIGVYGILFKDEAGPDEPHVLVVDLGKNQIAADVAVASLIDGPITLAAGGAPDTPETPLRNYGAGRAWDLRNDRLYLVHPTGERVTTIDLQNGTLLAQAPIRRPQSLADRLLSWLILPAEAKLEPGERRTAAVSPDGTRLYVTGARQEVTRQRDGRIVYRDIPLGLQVINTRDFTEVRRLDLASGDLALSPTGEWLLLTGSRTHLVVGEPSTQQASGLYVVDARRLEPSAPLGRGIIFSLDSFSSNGRYAYVRRWEAPRPGDTAGRLMVQPLDLKTQRLEAERQVDGYVPLGLLSVIASPRS